MPEPICKAKPARAGKLERSWTFKGMHVRTSEWRGGRARERDEKQMQDEGGRFANPCGSTGHRNPIRHLFHTIYTESKRCEQTQNPIKNAHRRSPCLPPAATTRISCIRASRCPTRTCNTRRDGPCPDPHNATPQHSTILKSHHQKVATSDPHNIQP